MKKWKKLIIKLFDKPYKFIVIILSKKPEMSELALPARTSTAVVRDIMITVALTAGTIEFVNWIRKEKRYHSVWTFICSYPGWSLLAATSFGCIGYLFGRPVVNMLPGLRH